MTTFSHVNDENQPRMVNVGDKPVTHRRAVAQAIVTLDEPTIALLKDGQLVSKKGPVFQTAIIAGSMAVKQTHHLIPFCHGLPIEGCDITISVNDQQQVDIRCDVSTTAKTGVEMEALTGANVAALTVYDMCKSASRFLSIDKVHLLHKSGGKHDVDVQPC